MHAAQACLRSVREQGINLVDTANAYGPVVAELLARQVLHQYDNVVMATKGGMLRPGPEQWSVDCRPGSLRGAVEASLKVLGVERIDRAERVSRDPAQA